MCALWSLVSLVEKLRLEQLAQQQEELCLTDNGAGPIETELLTTAV